MILTPGQEPPEFTAARNATLDRVILIAAERVQSVSPHIFTEDQLFNGRDKGPERRRMMELDSEDCAEREAWNLMLQGFKHLRSGGPGGNPGMLVFALSKATLRNSSLANSLGIAPPRFEDKPHLVRYQTGREKALFECQGLVSAAFIDAPRSKKIIDSVLRSEDLAAAFGMTLTSPQELKNLFRTVQKNTGVAPPEEARDYRTKFQQDIKSLHENILYTFELLHKAYVQTCEELDNRLRHFPAEKLQPKSPRLDS